MVFCLKDAHAMLRCDHTPLWKFVYSVTKNNKVNNWSPGICAIALHTDFKYMKGKENVLVDSWSRLRCLGIYEDNDPEKSWYECDIDKNTVCSVDSNKIINNKFEIDNIKYCLNEKDIINLQFISLISRYLPSHMDDLDLAKIKHYNDRMCIYQKWLLNVNQRKITKHPIT